MVMQVEKTGRTSFAPLPESPNLQPLYDRESELNERLTELVGDRAGNLITRAQFLEGTAELRAELDEVRKMIGEAGRYAGPVTTVDIEAAYDEFDRLELHEQREYVRGAFTLIEVQPRGKGRRRVGEPLWKPEHLITTFTREWEQLPD
jgi:hypothetical protein